MLGLAAALTLNGCGDSNSPGEMATEVSRGVVRIEASPQDLPVPPFQPDAQMQAVIAAMATANPLPIHTLTPRQAREQPTPRDAVNAVLAMQGLPPAVEPVGSVVHRTIMGSDENDILVRIYTPAGPGPFPVLVYYHGGGWVVYNLDVYDPSARALTNAAGAIVVSVAYRQAPENFFPAAADDAFAAYRWALDSASVIGGDPNRVAVGGESAGGNLAAVVALMARDKGVKLPVHQLLVYPIGQASFDTPSYHENANAPFLTRLAMQWFYDKYLNKSGDGDNPYASPLQDDNLSGLPPATIINAQIDVLRSDGEMYAQRLQQAGVAVTQTTYPGVTHEFFSMSAVLDQARVAVQQAGAALRAAFGT